MVFPCSLAHWDESQLISDDILGFTQNKGVEMMMLETITKCNLHRCLPIIYYLICHRYTEVCVLTDHLIHIHVCSNKLRTALHIMMGILHAWIC